MEIVVFGKRARPPVGTSEPVRLGPRPTDPADLGPVALAPAMQYGRVPTLPDQRSATYSPIAEARRSDSHAATKNTVLRALVDAIDPAQITPLDAESKREEIRDLANDIIVIKNMAMTIAEQEDLLEDICNDVFGSGPLEALLARDGVAAVMVTGSGVVSIEVAGEFADTGIRIRDKQRLLDRVIRAARRRGDALRINHITDVSGLDGDAIVTQDLFVFDLIGQDAAGRRIGRSTVTGRSRLWRRARVFGVDTRLAAAIGTALTGADY
ncbi:MAG: hypothetical protein ACXWVA_01970 [Rhodoplanes sp.]